jgi:hypothetical protein
MQELHPVDIVIVEEDEILIIEFNEVLPHGEGILSIGFQGILSDKMKGFYRRLFIFTTSMLFFSLVYHC